MRWSSEWHEAWTLSYWREYLGRIGGWVGWTVQRRCVRIRQHAFCFSRLHADRLVAEGMAASPTVLRGEYVGPLIPRVADSRDPSIVFAGRFIPEKRVEALISMMEPLAELEPGLRCDIYGDGPERARVEASIEAHGLADRV